MLNAIRICFDFALLRNAVGLKKKKNLRHFFLNIANKTNCDLFAQIFLRFVSAALFGSSFDWLTVLSVSLMIGQSYHFGFKCYDIQLKTILFVNVNNCTYTCESMSATSRLSLLRCLLTKLCSDCQKKEVNLFYCKVKWSKVK